MGATSVQQLSGVVALDGVGAARAVEAAHGVQQPVNHGHAHAQPRAPHRRHVRPRVLLGVVAGKTFATLRYEE